MPIIEMTSLHADEPRLAAYRNMRDAELAQRLDPLDASAHGGAFIAEGELVVRRLVASRFEVESVLTTPTRLAAVGDVIEQLKPEVPVFLLPQNVLNEVVGFNMHRGLLAIGRRGGGVAVGDLTKRAGPLLVLEDLVNHDNLGGVFRNAAALGGTGIGVLLSPRCADPLYRKSLRVSMGLALSVPFARVDERAWPGVLDQLADQGWQTWAMTPGEGSVELGEAVGGAPGRVAIVLGSEGPGLTERAMARAGRRVRISMRKADPVVDSLNVGMAAGITLAMLGESGWIRT